MSRWVARMRQDRLEDMLPAAAREALRSARCRHTDIDRIGRALATQIPHLGSASVKPAPRGLWERVRREVRLIVCTKDAKYRILRARLIRSSRKAESVIVGWISAAVGHALGAEAGFVSSLVVLSLLSAIRVGVEVWCRASPCPHLRVRIGRRHCQVGLRLRRARRSSSSISLRG